MDTVRSGLRAGDLEKDTYGRVRCVECGEALEMRHTSDSVGKLRFCPSCSREWQDVR